MGENCNKQQYSCPMHPEVQQDQPGSCSKCGMDLKPKADEGKKSGGCCH